MDSAGGSFLQERVALIVQSWWKFAENKKLVEEDVTLDLIKDQDGVERLAACPTVGEVFGDLMGIDIGSLDKSQG
jgi:hypothetical protein